jgi:hypothetical protein
VSGTALLLRPAESSASTVTELFNHANYYVQNVDGVNPLQYNPIGTNCGDGSTLK